MHQMEKVPQLKKVRKKRGNKKLLWLLTLFFTILLVVLFLRSPLNQIHEIIINGNHLVTDNQILHTAGLELDMPYLGVDEDEVVEKIRQLSAVSEVKIEKHFPGVIILQIKEHERVAFLLKDNGLLIPVLENGTTLPLDEDWSGMIDRPIIRDNINSNRLKQLAAQLYQLDDRVLSRISEIGIDEQENDPDRLQLFMKDGFQVKTSITDFAENMSWYPSFVHYLNQEGKNAGIVTLLEGKWFVPYEDDLDTEAEDPDDENP